MPSRDYEDGFSDALAYVAGVGGAVGIWAALRFGLNAPEWGAVGFALVELTTTGVRRAMDRAERKRRA